MVEDCGVDIDEVMWSCEGGFIFQCKDDFDNEEDGFIDGLDFDCEYFYYFRENKDFYVLGEYFLVGQCYDGIDNDGDGVMDVDDLSCWNLDFGYQVDGFLDDEVVDFGMDCINGFDDDEDGWFDGQDFDCVFGLDVVELGLGMIVCNDGIDNDCDGFIDVDDVDYCNFVIGNYEGLGLFCFQ